MGVVVVAALSARMLAEAAARDGHGVVALDLFGDADTRRAALRWTPIGQAGGMRLDAERFLKALALEARRGEAFGWIPGAGFEGRPELLAAGARVLPLAGLGAAAVRRVRDPIVFFGTLDALGIGHPEVRAEPPAAPGDWLLKDAHGCGGWHIRRAGSHRRRLRVPYYQRRMAGTPMSATFLADGARVRLLGLNELIVRPFGPRPYVYGGCIGPVALGPGPEARVLGIAAALARVFGLRGWCSLDFIRAGEEIGVLEVNPRPPASLALYARRGLVDAHLAACGGALPDAATLRTCGVAGNEVVYARRPFRLGETRAASLAARRDVHDLAAPHARFARGDPVCSVSASGASVAEVRRALAMAHDELTLTLEALPCPMP